MNKEKISKIIEQYKSPKIAIIGDFMIDQFIYGQINRINPEALAPLLSYEGEYTQLGGAGFVSSILKKIDSDITIFGVVGNDSNAQIMKELFQKEAITYELFTDDTRPTTCKQRIDAKNSHGRSIKQQMIRIDYEKSHPINSNLEKKIIDKLRDEHFDIIIVSDYNKGTITQEILNFLTKEKSPNSLLIADPKKPLSAYKDFDYIKPNRFEMSQLVNKELKTIAQIQEIAKKVQNDYTFKNLIISLDKNGLFYHNNENQYGLIPTAAQEVYDVSGAGDTIISIIARFALSSLTIEELLTLANAAASIIIRQKGNKNISLELLIKELNK